MWRRDPETPDWLTFTLFFRQANLKLCKGTIRLFRYKLLNPICVWLKRESLVPAKLVWTDTARFAFTLDDSVARGFAECSHAGLLSLRKRFREAPSPSRRRWCERMGGGPPEVRRAGYVGQDP